MSSLPQAGWLVKRGGGAAPHRGLRLERRDGSTEGAGGSFGGGVVGGALLHVAGFKNWKKRWFRFEGRADVSHQDHSSLHNSQVATVDGFRFEAVPLPAAPGGALPPPPPPGAAGLLPMSPIQPRGSGTVGGDGHGA